MRAVLALRRGDSATAIEELESAVPHQTGSPRLLIGALKDAAVPSDADAAPQCSVNIHDVTLLEVPRGGSHCIIRSVRGPRSEVLPNSDSEFDSPELCCARSARSGVCSRQLSFRPGQYPRKLILLRTCACLAGKAATRGASVPATQRPGRTMS